MYLALAPAPPGWSCAPGSPGWAVWGGHRRDQAAVQPLLASTGALGRRASPDGRDTAAPGMDLRTAAELGGVAADAMGRVGWRPGMLFASLGERGGGRTLQYCCPWQRHAGCAMAAWTSLKLSVMPPNEALPCSHGTGRRNRHARERPGRPWPPPGRLSAHCAGQRRARKVRLGHRGHTAGASACTRRMAVQGACAACRASAVFCLPWPPAVQAQPRPAHPLSRPDSCGWRFERRPGSRRFSVGRHGNGR